jgi:hypothetical protein
VLLYWMLHAVRWVLLISALFADDRCIWSMRIDAAIYKLDPSLPRAAGSIPTTMMGPLIGAYRIAALNSTHHEA